MAEGDNPASLGDIVRCSTLGPRPADAPPTPDRWRPAAPPSRRASSRAPSCTVRPGLERRDPEPVPSANDPAGLAGSSTTNACCTAWPASSCSCRSGSSGAGAGIIDRSFFGRPTGIIEAGIVEVQTERFWGDLFASFSEFAIGYILAIILGIPIGLAAGRFRRLQYALDPWLNFFNSLPRIALLPVLVIMFGVFGPGSKIAVVFLGAFFSIVIPTMQGVKTTDRRYRRCRPQLQRLGTADLPVGRHPVDRAVHHHRPAPGDRPSADRRRDGRAVHPDRGDRRPDPPRDRIAQGDRALFGVLLFTISGIIGVEFIRRLEKRFQKWRPMTSLDRR